MAYTLLQLAEHLGATLDGDEACLIEQINTLEQATPKQISFLANKRYRNQLATTNAAAVVLHPNEAEYFSGNKIIVADPYVAYAKLAQYMDTTPASASGGVHPTAVIHPSANISSTANIGAYAVIEAHAHIGEHVQIGSHCFIGEYAKVAANSKLWSNVSVYHRVEIGEHCLVQSGAIIGSDGFGYANEQGQWVKIPQLGSVIIGDKVEIGACTTVDRGALDDTVIANNVIIDNQCQIAHNVHLGEGTAIAGCAVIAGSTKIGKYCQIGGLSGIAGHIEICDKVILTGRSMVTNNITEAGIYSSGIPHSKNKDWRKTVVHLRNIGDMSKRLKALEAAFTNAQDENNS